MREVKGLSPDAGRGADAGVKGLRPYYAPNPLRGGASKGALKGRSADADREGRFDIMHKARMFVKVGWEERKQRFGIGPLRPTPAQARMLLRSGWFVP